MGEGDAAWYWEQAIVDAGKVLASTAGLSASVLLLLCILALCFEPAKAAVASLRGFIDWSVAPLFGMTTHCAIFLIFLPFGGLAQFLGQMAAFIVPGLLGEAARELEQRVVRAALEL